MNAASWTIYMFAMARSPHGQEKDKPMLRGYASNSFLRCGYSVLAILMVHGN